MEGRSDRKKWRKLLKEELGNKAWKIIDLPEGRKPLHCKWVFTVKRIKN
jgi:hypothetical protein